MPNLSTLVTNTIPPSGITADKLSGGQTGAAPVYGARAWVNFNGTLSAGGLNPSQNNQPVFIHASGNVSSVVKTGVGNYLINFNTNMLDANYCIAGTVCSDGVTNNGFLLGPRRTFAKNLSSCQVVCLAGGTTSGTSYDASEISVVVFR